MVYTVKVDENFYPGHPITAFELPDSWREYPGQLGPGQLMWGEPQFAIVNYRPMVSINASPISPELESALKDVPLLKWGSIAEDFSMREDTGIETVTFDRTMIYYDSFSESYQRTIFMGTAPTKDVTRVWETEAVISSLRLLT